MRILQPPSMSAPRQPSPIVRPEQPREGDAEKKRDTLDQVSPLSTQGHATDNLGDTTTDGSKGSIECDVTPLHTGLDSFLLPVWRPGFWAMPPGGLTRRLIPSRSFVNPDQTFANATGSDAAAELFQPATSAAVAGSEAVNSGSNQRQ
jgi:hypothetical protein